MTLLIPPRCQARFVLTQRGCTFGKTVVLCGGPDWPTSVLTGTSDNLGPISATLGGIRPIPATRGQLIKYLTTRARLAPSLCLPVSGLSRPKTRAASLHSRLFTAVAVSRHPRPLLPQDALRLHPGRPSHPPLHRHGQRAHHGQPASRYRDMSATCPGRVGDMSRRPTGLAGTWPLRRWTMACDRNLTC